MSRRIVVERVRIPATDSGTSFLHATYMKEEGKSSPTEGSMVRYWLAQTKIVVLAIVALLGTSSTTPETMQASRGTPVPTPKDCPVTRPNDVPYPEFGEVEPPSARDPDPEGGYGNDALWTNLWMWGEGEVPVPSSHVLPDGSFGEMKWAWYRYVPGTLTIDGRRLDAPAPPLRASVPEGYGSTGFQVSGIIFPTEGCWEITGRVGDASLTFVTLVIPPPGMTVPPRATPVS
jgi:hypothetical protein